MKQGMHAAADHMHAHRVHPKSGPNDINSHQAFSMTGNLHFTSQWLLFESFLSTSDKHQRAGGDAVHSGSDCALACEHSETNALQNNAARSYKALTETSDN